MKKILPLLLLMLCGLFFCGCATQYKVNVNGLTAGPDAVLGAACVVLPSNSLLAADLTFREFRPYIADALTKKGYHVVASAEQAQTGVLVNYWIGDPLEKIHSSPSVGFGTGYYHGWGRHWGRGFAPSFYFPLDDISSYTTYGSYLSLAAYDINQYKATGRMTYAWQVTVALRSTSSDLRAMMPVLVAAAMPYIGHNTGRQIVVTVPADDPYVQELESMAPSASITPRTDYTRPQ